MGKINFKCYVDKEELKEVNISSLLFLSGTVICDLTVDNIRASLIVNGETRIINENNGDSYRNCYQFPQELTDMIKNGVDFEEHGYIIDMNNWFEIFLDEVEIKEDNTEMKYEIDYEVADVEGTLESDKYSMEEMLKKFMVEFMVESKECEYEELENLDIIELEEYLKKF